MSDTDDMIKWRKLRDKATIYAVTNLLLQIGINSKMCKLKVNHSQNL